MNLRLSEYDFKVQHRSCSKTRYVDALSRHVQAVTTIHQLSREVREEQRKDMFCSNPMIGNVAARMDYFREDEAVIYTGSERMGNPSQL